MILELGASEGEKAGHSEQGERTEGKALNSWS